MVLDDGEAPSGGGDGPSAGAGLQRLRRLLSGVTGWLADWLNLGGDVDDVLASVAIF